MKTYTLAMIGDWGVATAPDGDFAMLDERVSKRLREVPPEYGDGHIRYITGLTLYRYVPSENEADVVIVADDETILGDADGLLVYEAAGYPRTRLQ